MAHTTQAQTERKVTTLLETVSWAPKGSLPPGWKRDLWIKSCGLCPAIRPGLTLRESEGSLVVCDPTTRAAHVLNQAKATVFLLANGTRTVDDIIAGVAEAIGATGLHGDALRAGVSRAITDFVEKGILIIRRCLPAA